jgi:hypothetical protein
LTSLDAAAHGLSLLRSITTKGEKAMAQQRVARHAVVIGAGIGGLSAARALADHFEQVTVLERDTLPPDAAQRSGTPQARHVHALLAGGLHALGELFPGFEGDLERAGAVRLHNALDVRVERPGFDPYPARDLGLVTYAASRPTIEFVIRQRLAQQPNVTMHEATTPGEKSGLDQAPLFPRPGQPDLGVRCADRRRGAR